MSEGNTRSTAVVLKDYYPQCLPELREGGIIYREINSLRQSIEFYNLSGIGCIVPSAKATDFHVIKIKKKKSKNMPLTTILAAIIFVSWHLYWPSRGRQAVRCAIII